MKEFLMDLLFKIQSWYKTLNKNDKIIFYSVFFLTTILFIIFLKNIWVALAGAVIVFSTFSFFMKLKI